MIAFYLPAVLFILVTLILLGFALKEATASQKYMHIFLSISFCLFGAFIWLFSGLFTRYPYPYQSAAMAKFSVSPTEKHLRFNALIKDGQSREKPASIAKAPVNNSVAEATHEDNSQMLAMAETLEQKLKSGESEPQSWALLARTYQAIGEFDKAALALMEGLKSFEKDDPIHEKFKHDIQNFIDSGYVGQYIEELKASLS